METLIEKYDKLQSKYGSKELNSVYGYGRFNNPRVALVFMNPTKRNIATDKFWKGIRAQWLGTKQIWNFLTECRLFDSNINKEIKVIILKGTWVNNNCFSFFFIGIFNCTCSSSTATAKYRN